MWMRIREGASAGGTPFLADASLAVAGLLHALLGRMQQAETELDPVRRAALFIRMNDLLIEDVVVIPVVWRQEVSAVSHTLRGLALSPWGSILSNARQLLPSAWWLTAFPGLAIFLTVTSYNLVGEGLRDATDPRLRR